MSPPPHFSAVSFEPLVHETAEFLSRIKKRFDLTPNAFLNEVVG